MSTKQPRVLIIGSNSVPGVRSLKWTDTECPTVPDYDFTILNMRTLEDRDPKPFCLLKVFRQIADGIQRSINKDGVVVVICKPSALANFFEELKGYFVSDAYMWLFPYLKIEKEETETCNVKINMFPKYLSKVAAMASHEMKFSIDRSRLGKNFEVKHIAESREGKAIALNVLCYDSYVELLNGIKRIHPGAKRENDIPTPKGMIVFLPELPSISSEESIKLLMEDIGMPIVSQLPEWALQIDSGSITKLKERISQIKEQSRVLFSELDSVSSDLGQLQSYKRMLIASGTELEHIFKQCIEELGGQVVPSKYSQEEYVLQYEGKDYLVEAKGNSKSISLGDLRQLLDYLVQAEHDTGVKHAGILFGNAWRTLPVSERDTKDTPYFPQNVIERAQRDGIVLVSSYDFFKAFMAFTDGKLTGADVLRALTTPNGLQHLLEGH